MDQAVNPVVQLEERPEVGELGNLAPDVVADLVKLADHFPGVLVQLLDTKRDSLLLRIDFQHHGLDLIAFLQQFGGVVNLTGPRHVGNVNHAVNVRFNFDKRTVRGHVAHPALNLGARGILVHGGFPGIIHGLAQTQGDLLLLALDVQHHRFHFLAHLQHVTGAGNALGPGHLGNMDQPLDPFLDLDKGAVGHDVDHPALDARGDRVFFLDAFPRVRGLLFQSQRHPFFLPVDLKNHRLHLLTDFQHLGRMRNPAPGHIGDVDEPVYRPQINERAKIGDVLDHARAELAGLDFAQEIGAQLGPFRFQQFPPGNHHIVAIFIDLEDLKLIFLTEEIVHVSHRRSIHLRTWQESLDANIHHQTALHPPLHDTLGDAALVVVSDKAVPRFLKDRFFHAQQRQAVFAFVLLEHRPDFVADRHRRPVRKFLLGHETFALEIDVNRHAGINLVHDDAGDYRAFLDSRARVFAQQFRHRRHVLQVQEDRHGGWFFLFAFCFGRHKIPCFITRGRKPKNALSAKDLPEMGNLIIC